MKKEKQKKFCLAVGMLTAFLLWTAAVQVVDVQRIGPRESAVGLATMNQLVHNAIGVCMPLYMLTDWLGLVAIGFAMGFAVLGMIQWIKRKSLRKVDYSILVLGGFYMVVIAAYIFFEIFVINYRPVLINGNLEASYPSSTTMVVMCVMSTAIMQLNARIKNDALKRCVDFVIIAFIVFMIVGRLISGVHWFSDIIGGILLSAGFILLYDSFSR